jgi:hypothetical protein
VLTPEALREAAASLATAALKPVAALQVLTLEHDVLPRFGDPDARVEARKTHAVVWRKGFQVFHVALAPDEADALRRALAGRRLDEVCEAFAERDDPAGAAFGAIGSWVAEGMLAGLTNDPPSAG